MKKHLFWLIVISLNALIAQAQEINIKIDTLGAGIYQFSVLPNNPPNPLTEAFATEAAWSHFWMFSDGRYSNRDTFIRTFPNTGPVEVTVKRRGKYSSDSEPPPAERSMNVNPPLGPAPTIPTTDPDAKIVLEWGAARLGDTIYAAIVVSNKGDETTDGYVKLHYPTGAFREGIEMTYIPNALEAVLGDNYSVEASDDYLEGRIQEWAIYNIPPLTERVIFVLLRLKTILDEPVPSDSTYQLWLDWGLNNEEAARASGGDDVSMISKPQDAETIQIQVGASDNKKSEPAAASAISAFNGRVKENVKMNFARDPNGLTVWPSFISPTQYMPPDKRGKPIDLEFTGYVENMGEVPADHVNMEIRFEARIDKPTFGHRSATLPSCLESGTPCTFTHDWVPPDSLLLYDFRNINLAPNAGSLATDNDIARRKAEFEFDIATKPNLVFRHGDQIVTNATVKMFNANLAREDSLDTDPAIVDVIRPGRQPFGLIFGAKIYSHLNNSDNAEGRGLSLTLRCPLIKPRGNSISSGYLQYMPKLYWQFELGYGQGAFQQPSDNQLFKVNFLHFTPVQLRYLHPVNLTSFLRYIGVSAGYSADYALSGKVNGRKAPLPSGFFDRFENELAVSLDFSNRLNVPSVTLGIGYKFRQNNLTGQSVNYSMPFVYAQLDIIRFRRHFAQVWNTVHRW